MLTIKELLNITKTTQRDLNKEVNLQKKCKQPRIICSNSQEITVLQIK